MAHALLSPSGASRWIACPPSARLEEHYPRTSNTAADEGTLAHALCELLLGNHLGLVKKALFPKKLKEIKSNPLYTAEMLGHANDYMNFVLDKFSAFENGYIVLEQKVDLQRFIPEGFGTVDCAIVADGVLDITDLKYGQGVLVEAQENKQMMLYALGCLYRFSTMYEIDTVRMTIYQPRLDNFSSYEISAEKLLEWGEKVVKPAAELAYIGGGNYTAGSHCKFCKAKNTCKALADYNLELAKFAFEDSNKLSAIEISEILEKAPDFINWINSIKEYALDQAKNHGVKWPKFKLVAGKSNRVFTSKVTVVALLKDKKIDENLFMSEPELLGITALEKNIGKSELQTLIGDFISKPPGAPTLVPEWDKRPELNSAEASAEAFKDI